MIPTIPGTLEQVRLAADAVRYARDFACRLVAQSHSLRAIQAHAELEGALAGLERAAAFLRAGQSAQFRSLVPPAEKDPRREPDG